MFSIGNYASGSTLSFEDSVQILKNGNTLYVGGSGEDNYSKIQDAIDDANCGYTIFVYNGIYNEKLEIKKSITLLGEDKNFTIIDGSIIEENITLIKIFVSNVKISRFSIKDARGIRGRAFSAIDKNALFNITTNIEITDNIFKNFSNGGYIANPKNCIISNNKLYNCCIGPYYTYPFLFKNDFSNNYVNGKPLLLYLNKRNFCIDGKEAGSIFLHRCRNVIIKNMNLSNVTVGIYISFCKRVYVINSTITNTGRGGIFVFHSKFCRFIGNTFVNDNWGIFFRKSNFNRIKNNNFISIHQPDWFATSFFNNWNKNYWGEQSSVPKKIEGAIGPRENVTWYNFDWRPLQEPYDKHNLIASQ